MATFFDKTKCYSTQKKGSFRWPTSNSMKNNCWESSKLTNLKINPSRENHAHFYLVNHLIKSTPENTLGLHFDWFNLQHQLLRNLKFYQLHFIWAPLALFGCFPRKDISTRWCCWVLVSHFLWTMFAGLLLLHCKSIRTVCWTERSDQKCPDKHWKIIGKLLYSKSRKIAILVTPSPMESARKSSGSIKTSLLIYSS